MVLFSIRVYKLRIYMYEILVHYYCIEVWQYTLNISEVTALRGRDQQFWEVISLNPTWTFNCFQNTTRHLLLKKRAAFSSRQVGFPVWRIQSATFSYILFFRTISSPCDFFHISTRVRLFSRLFDTTRALLKVRTSTKKAIKLVLIDILDSPTNSVTEESSYRTHDQRHRRQQ